MNKKSVICLLLSAAMLLQSTVILSSCGKKKKPQKGDDEVYKSSNISLEGLKVCESGSPIGIDTVPVFSWYGVSEDFGQFQTAYQVVVSSSAEKAKKGEGELWDSGRVDSAFCYSVRYLGEALKSHTKYYWAVRIWDADGAVTKYKCSSFVTGILSSKEWTGDWIGIEGNKQSLSLNDAKWIWSVGTNPGNSAPAGIPESTQYFRLEYSPDSDKTVKKAVFAYTADDEAIVYLNGSEISSTNAWTNGRICDITDSLQKENVIAAAAHNTANGYAGFVGKLVVTYTDSSKDTVVTDKDSWKVAKSAAEGWNTLSFDGSGFESPDMYCNFTNGPWSGIALSSGNDRASTYLRSELKLKDSVRSAYLSIAGLGYFDLEINGKAPDDSLLNCCNTQYNKTVLYRTFDVTSLLQKGDNALGVELGNGFYNEQGGVWNWGSASWRDEPKMKLQLSVCYLDGTSESFSSESASWKATNDGARTFSSIYYGESYDARKELGAFSAVGYDDSSWKSCDKMKAPSGTLVCQIEDPVKKVSEFEVKDIKKLSDGSYVLYAPEMITGWAKITFKNAIEGEKITILYGEKINADGSVQKLGGTDGTNASWWPERYNMTDEYISKGASSESFESKFSYKGYEYIQIWGYEGQLQKSDIKLYRVANDVEISGSFECSDKLINDLHAMMVRTMTNNMQGKPTDTPVWEKNGWLGDLNVALECFTYNFDCSNFLPNFIEIMEDCFKEYGLLPQMVPTANWGVTEQYVWNSVFVLSVYELYNVYGMQYYMEEQYSVLKKYANGIIGKMKQSSWIAPDGQLGDWVSPMNREDASYNESPNEGSGIVATAYVYKMLKTMSEIAALTGHGSDIDGYESAADSIYKAFNKKFYNKAGYYETKVWYNNGSYRTKFRQTSQLVPLAFGMVPEQYIQKVVDSLVDDIVSKDYHLDTGCVGAREILPVLSNCGYADVAYKILTRRTYPSWGFMTESGASSLWEMWETTTRSRAHYFLGTYDEWLYQYLAGVTNIKNGYESYTVNPYIPNELSYVNCKINTVRGELESSWKKNSNGSITMTLKVPFGSKASVYFPTGDTQNITLNGAVLDKKCAGVMELGSADGNMYAVLGSGSYVFVCKNDAPFVSRTDRITVNVKNNLPDIKNETNSDPEEGIVHPTGTNLALNKTVTASSAADSPDYGWSLSRLTNGDRKDKNKDGEYAGYTSNANTASDHSEWVSVDLEKLQSVNRVVCYASTPTPDIKNSCYCFAKDFEIQVSSDGESWTTVYSEKNYKVPSWGPLTFDFEAAEARYVRFYASSLYPKVTDGNRYYLQLCELEIY